MNVFILKYTKCTKVLILCTKVYIEYTYAAKYNMDVYSTKCCGHTNGLVLMCIIGRVLCNLVYNVLKCTFSSKYKRFCTNVYNR